MSEPVSSLTGNNDPFADIVRDFGDLSIDTQRIIFGDRLSEYRTEWQASGILDVIVDMMPIGEGERTVLLGRRAVQSPVEGMGALGAELYFRVTDVKRLGGASGSRRVRARSSSIPVAFVSEVGVMPASDFTAEQALIVSGQAAELDGLRVEGALPNLSLNLTGIFEACAENMTNRQNSQQ